MTKPKEFKILVNGEEMATGFGELEVKHSFAGYEGAADPAGYIEEKLMEMSEELYHLMGSFGYIKEVVVSDVLYARIEDHVRTKMLRAGIAYNGPYPSVIAIVGPTGQDIRIRKAEQKKIYVDVQFTGEGYITYCTQALNIKPTMLAGLLNITERTLDDWRGTTITVEPQGKIDRLKTLYKIVTMAEGAGLRGKIILNVLNEPVPGEENEKSLLHYVVDEPDNNLLRSVVQRVLAAFKSEGAEKVTQDVPPPVTTSWGLGPLQQVELFEIASKMKQQKLSSDFIAAAVRTATDFEGVYDLMKMWEVETDKKERAEIVADIQDMIDDCTRRIIIC